MLEQVPRKIKLMALVGAIAAGPFVVFSLLIAGPKGGLIAVGTLFVLSIVLYITTVRKYLDE